MKFFHFDFIWMDLNHFVSSLGVLIGSNTSTTKSRLTTTWVWLAYDLEKFTKHYDCNIYIRKVILDP